MIQRIKYHFLVPLIFVLSVAILLRVGAGAYSGHVMLFFIIVFFLSSIYHDHKESVFDMIFWATIRIYVYMTISVGLAIFYKEIYERIFL
jgi:hypothetical protein